MQSIENEKSSHTYEEAVSLTGNGKFHYIILVVSASALMAVIIEGLNMAFVLPIAKCDLNISTGEQGLINAAGFIGIMLTSHFWGFLADTWGRQKVLRTALLLSFLSCAASSLSYTSSMLLVTRVAVGLSISGVQATGISYLGEFHCNQNRSKYVTFAVMGISVGIVYQSLMGLAFLPMNWEYPMIGLVYTPWRLYLLTSSSIILLAFVAMLFLPESPKFMLAMGKPDEALTILRRVYAINSGKPKDEIRLEETGSNLASARGAKDVCRMMWNQTWPLFFPPYLGKIMMLNYLQFALFFVAHGIYLWLPQILSLYYENIDNSMTLCTAVSVGHANTLGVPASGMVNFTHSSAAMKDDNTVISCSDRTTNQLTYYVTTVYGLCFVLNYVFVAMTINRIGKRNLITAWISIAFIATLGLQWGNQFYLNAVLIFFLCSSAPCGSSICAIAADFFPTHYKGMALGLIMMVSRVGSIAGSNVVGALLFGNCTLLLGIDAVLLLSSAGIYYYLLRK